MAGLMLALNWVIRYRNKTIHDVQTKTAVDSLLSETCMEALNIARVHEVTTKGMRERLPAVRLCVLKALRMSQLDIMAGSGYAHEWI